MTNEVENAHEVIPQYNPDDEEIFNTYIEFEGTFLLTLIKKIRGKFI
jgi:hypothetical protein